MHLEKRRHVERDDFVISMRSFQGGLERAWASGAIRSSYVVLKAEAGADVGYFAHMFKSQGYIRALQATADFIRDGQDLNFGHFTRVDLPLPPLVEQAAIGRFLNHATRRIDRFIRAKRKLIALLNEQKQAIVQCAVTQGIDPNVRHVDSGVEWLGRVPAHWVVRRIKYLLREVDVRSATGDEMLLSMRMHHGIVPFAEHFARPPQAASLAGFKIVRPGQLVINRMQAGNGVIFPSNLHGLVSPDYAVFDPICDLDVAFLGELFRCRKVRGKFRAESKGLGTGTSGFLRLYNDRLGAIPIALPPRVEQNAILHGLAGRLEGLNAALDRTEREIALIREYRARLIADVVTGQLDVRAAAASLPPDEPTPSDSPDPDSDSPDLAEDDLPPEDDPA
jgi:type I restriction enzyme S subunit